MQKYNIGDEVVIQRDADQYNRGFPQEKIIHGCTPKCPQKGRVVEVNELQECLLISYNAGDRTMVLSFPMANVILVKSNPNQEEDTMNEIAKNLLDADTQALIEAGFLNESLALTAEGTTALQALSFKMHKDNLIVLAKEVVAQKNGCVAK